MFSVDEVVSIIRYIKQKNLNFEYLKSDSDLFGCFFSIVNDV